MRRTLNAEPQRLTDDELSEPVLLAHRPIEWVRERYALTVDYFNGNFGGIQGKRQQGEKLIQSLIRMVGPAG